MLPLSSPFPTRTDPLNHCPSPTLNSCPFSAPPSLTIVGHSLGAGTAVLVAAELRNSLADMAGDNVADGSGSGSGSGVDTVAAPDASEPSAPAARPPLPAAQIVRAVAFACPPVACPALSEAFRQDQVPLVAPV